jgi:HTH-type transcriptional regulator, sugar sensing transcriptional regulator
MGNTHQAKLEKWGLSPLEAQVYLALVRSPQRAGASAIATTAGIPRPSVYPILKSLAEKNLIENGQGYGSQFAALPPEKALPRLIASEKENLSAREHLTGELVRGLRSLMGGKVTPPEIKLIELLRDPRVVAERLQKLQHEAAREVAVLQKAPIIAPKTRFKNNPAEIETLRKGVKHKVIYETAVVDDVAPYLKGWIEAGEEARIYQGSLPLKLALFDSKIAWMPLETTAKRHPTVSVLIRHPALGKALRLLFDYLWTESEPIRLGSKRSRERAGKRMVTRTTN